MTVEELLKKGAATIRGNTELTALFIQYYMDILNKPKPACNGCGWNDKYRELFNKVFNTNDMNFIEKTKTFQIKSNFSSDILTYYEDRVPKRIYAHSADDNFIREFLKHGTSEQIEERVNMFIKLPDPISGEQITLEEAINEVQVEKKVTKKKK